MWQRFLILASVSAVAMSTMQDVRATQPEAEMPTAAALRFFEHHRDETIEAFLDRQRPAPLDAASRSGFLANLPRDLIVVRPSRSMRGKIAAAERVLEFSGRSGVIDIRVFDDGEASALLFFRAVLLVSIPTLDVLDAEEFAAVTAHELGHDYDWSEYWTAVQQHDECRARLLELQSDGIAVLTLQAMGLSPERLVTAASKMTRFNESRAAARSGVAGSPADGGTGERYVPLGERIAFIRAVARLEWASHVHAGPPERSLPRTSGPGRASRRGCWAIGACASGPSAWRRDAGRGRGARRVRRVDLYPDGR